MTREALLQKARKYAIERIKPQTLDPLCDLNAVAQIAADFCLSELAAKDLEIEKLRKALQNCLAALEEEFGPTLPVSTWAYPELPPASAMIEADGLLKAEAALQWEGPTPK